MNEYEQHQEVGSGTADTGYWNSVLIAGAIFAVISFVLGLIFGYMQIGSEPTGSFVSPFMVSGVVICLASCFGGLLAVWHYTKEVTPQIKLGRGALIGFLTGAVIVVFTALLNEFWHFVDPDYTEKLVESIVANVEEMDVPADTKDQLIDQMAAGVRDRNILTDILWGIPATGLLNLLTGMLGVKLFGQKEEETF